MNDNAVRLLDRDAAIASKLCSHNDHTRMPGRTQN